MGVWNERQGRNIELKYKNVTDEGIINVII
jgi:hypothetical protein